MPSKGQWPKNISCMIFFFIHSHPLDFDLIGLHAIGKGWGHSLTENRCPQLTECCPKAVLNPNQF